MPDSAKVRRVRRTLGEQQARRYKAVVDIEQMHLSEFGGGRR